VPYMGGMTFIPFVHKEKPNFDKLSKEDQRKVNPEASKKGGGAGAGDKEPDKEEEEDTSE